MSRSYKKSPICKANSTFAKKMANRKVRRTKNIPSGSAYRKVFNSWDICDNTLRSDDYIGDIRFNEYIYDETEQEAIKRYNKMFLWR